MSKLILAAILCGLAISCMGATIRHNEDRISSLTDNNEDVAVAYLDDMGTPPVKPTKEAGYMTIYKATYYVGYLPKSSQCFKDYESDKMDTGLMTDLLDVCIREEDGWLYLYFQQDEDSMPMPALLIGDTSFSYTVVYVSTTEEFIITKGVYDGTTFNHTNSHVILSMYLVNVFMLCQEEMIEAYIIQANGLSLSMSHTF